MKTNLMEAINDIDPKYVEMARPGKKSAHVRLVALIAALLAVAVLIPVVVVFANKAPEPETPVVAMTTEETKEDEKTPVTETPVETKETEVVPTETQVEPTPTETLVEPTPTETLVEPTPTKTPVEIVDPTKVPYDPENPAYASDGKPEWPAACTQPIAIFRIVEITDKKHTYEISKDVFFDFTKVRCELIYSSGFCHFHNKEFLKTSEAFEKGDNCIYIEDSILENASIGDVFLSECFEVSYGSEKYCMFAFQNEYFYSCISIVDGRLVDKGGLKTSLGVSCLTFNRYLLIFRDEKYIDYHYNNPEEEVMNRLPQKPIGNGSTIEEIIEVIEWFNEIYSKSSNLKSPLEYNKR